MIDKDNIFKYATKELSQDAFLSWLFDNYDSEHKDVRETSRRLICKFAQIDYYKDIHISDLKVLQQSKRIDILYLF